MPSFGDFISNPVGAIGNTVGGEVGEYVGSGQAGWIHPWLNPQIQDPANLPIVGGNVGAALGEYSNNEAIAEAMREANERNYQIARQQFSWRVQDARNMGISPLAAMGLPTSTATMKPVAGGKVNSALKAVDAFAQGNYNRKMQDLQLEEITARVANIHSDTALQMARAQKLKEPVGSTVDLDRKTEQNMAAVGLDVRTPLGEIKLGPEASAEVMEQEYGGVVGEIHGLLRWLKNYKMQQPHRFEHGPTFKKREHDKREKLRKKGLLQPHYDRSIRY